MSLKINGFDLPAHISYSALDTYISCGQRYYLSRIEKVAEQPAWWFVAGNAVHSATEEIDRAYPSDAELAAAAATGPDTNVFSDAFDRAFQAEIDRVEQESNVPRSEWRSGGRASKAWPDKENYDWWVANGPAMVKSWVSWRLGSGWSIAEFDGNHAIEFEIDFPIGDDFFVRMIIDRVMVNGSGELAVIDLKSGSRSPSSDLQLAVYATGMDRMLGVRPQYGAYWMAREGTSTPLADLDHLSSDRVVSMLKMFDTARKSQIFLPNLKECHYCGVAEHCEWSKK